MRLAPAWSLLTAVVLGVALTIPLAELTLLVFQQFPSIAAMVEENKPIVTKMLGLQGDVSAGMRWWYFIAWAVLPAGCEEVAFRGFILTGLTRRFRPVTAIFISAFLYSVYPMNLFEVLPRFLLGLALGFIVVRSNSIWPAVLAHLTLNTVRRGALLIPGLEQALPAAVSHTSELGVGYLFDFIRIALFVGSILLSIGCLALIEWLGRRTLSNRPFPTILFPARPSAAANGQLSSDAAGTSGSLV
jgi:sodium transport system permease protein